MTFGIIGFSFAILAMSQMKILRSKITALEEAVEKLLENPQ
jgi:hypothetical protein